MKFIIKLGLASGKVFNIFGPALLSVPMTLLLFLEASTLSIPGPVLVLPLMVSTIVSIIGLVVSYGNYTRHRDNESAGQ